MVIKIRKYLYKKIVKIYNNLFPYTPSIKEMEEQSKKYFEELKNGYK